MRQANAKTAKNYSVLAGGAHIIHGYCETQGKKPPKNSPPSPPVVSMNGKSESTPVRLDKHCSPADGEAGRRIQNLMSKKFDIEVGTETITKEKLQELLDNDTTLTTLEANVLRMIHGASVNPDTPLEHASSYADDSIAERLIKAEIKANNHALGPRGMKKAKIIARLKEILDN